VEIVCLCSLCTISYLAMQFIRECLLSALHVRLLKYDGEEKRDILAQSV
jgi:hypothetical protein